MSNSRLFVLNEKGNEIKAVSRIAFLESGKDIFVIAKSAWGTNDVFTTNKDVKIVWDAEEVIKAAYSLFYAGLDEDYEERYDALENPIAELEKEFNRRFYEVFVPDGF